MINGEDFAKEVLNFYRNLYTSSYSEQDAKLLFNKISHRIPLIDVTFRTICEDDLCIEEFDQVINKIASDHSPGSDGITANFYKHFWDDIKILLFQAINECIIQKEQMTTMKEDMIQHNSIGLPPKTIYP